MPQKIRKQIYIESRQDALLKQLAKARGVTQAEIVRRAIERETGTRDMVLSRPDPGVWDEARSFIVSLRERGPVSGRRKWTREDAHAR